MNMTEEKSEFLNSSLSLDTSVELSQNGGKKSLDFSKIKVGLKTLEDAILSNKSLTVSKINPTFGNKEDVLRAISNKNYATLREISDFYFNSNGIYSGLCLYKANLFRYDWMITPYIVDEKVKSEKTLTGYGDALTRFDNFNVKAFLGQAALKVIKYGAYYGYKIQRDRTNIAIQELPANYCRTRFEVNGVPAVEFYMKYFDDTFKTEYQRLKMLKLFPKEFQTGYRLYKEGKLPAEFPGDKEGWYLLDPECAFMFNNNGDEIPMFINIVPYLIDLEFAQELDRKKTAQQLVKIIIQTMPLDKNGDMIFDMDEAADLHNNAVRMLGKAIGVDVLTTFANVDVVDLADRNSVTSVDELEKVERTVYNVSGTAKNLFNTEGNTALDRSIINDEMSLNNLIYQFERFLNGLLEDLNNYKKCYYKVKLLSTTHYNYKELSKQYKELSSMGQSQLLPMIALGHSQSSILANAYFETRVLDLVSLFIPPLTSNTMNSDALKEAKAGEEKTPGRKEKADNEKSDKTIANRESMN